ncbi:ABC transporter ATP-binding protein [Variovorax humicola]|uniref:ABC transporter ATP-binding protein n=1 Tax=Variovorax humicola TaxID=1769758 RepID=A0ABU8W3B8_9BURK
MCSNSWSKKRNGGDMNSSAVLPRSARGIEIRGVSKSYGEASVLKSIDLNIAAGELVCFLGPSGCGKTTLLRTIAGFNPADSGDILINGRDVSSLPPNERQCGLVFQAYALFPHMTVRDNVGYGLRVRGWEKKKIAGRVDEMLQLVKLTALADRYPRQMSGGQQQRVAIARALAIQPDALLLDEPLSNLDAKLREEIRFELRTLIKSIGITTIFVTHDQEEAMVVGDRIVVMNQGVIDQVGTAQEIYRRPSTAFVAEFVGQNNLLPVTASPSTTPGRARVEVAGECFDVLCSAPLSAAQPMRLALRPEHITVTESPAPPGTPAIRCTVTLAAFLGATARYEVETAQGAMLKVSTPARELLLPVGQHVNLLLDLSRAVLVPIN